MTGTILDIQRFSLHDGPGIRTTVFLKGCPFQCTWCSNPESIHPSPQLSWDVNKCHQCFACVEICPTGALQQYDEKLKVRFDLCNACGLCIGECPHGSLKIFGRETGSKEVISEVMKDRDYYIASSGGMTVSGGDPLFQFEFLIELLKKAKAEGIHTCLETEGYGGREQFDMLLGLVDLFYFDYKMTDEFLHKKYTGKLRQDVMENLEYLDKMGADIVLRCVLIPGINDNETHFSAIAALSQKYESIRGIHVMPYHSFGAAKYKQIGRKYMLKEKVSVENGEAENWVSVIAKYGGRNVTVG